MSYSTFIGHPDGRKGAAGMLRKLADLVETGDLYIRQYNAAISHDTFDGTAWGALEKSYIMAHPSQVTFDLELSGNWEKVCQAIAGGEPEKAQAVIRSWQRDIRL